MPASRFPEYLFCRLRTGLIDRVPLGRLESVCLEEFGDVEHGTNYEACRPVFVDGVRVVGPTYEPALVADFFRTGGKVTKCPTKWAYGALRFSPGWDKTSDTSRYE